MKLFKIIKDYFEYYPSERNGLLFVAVILFFWIIGLLIYSRIPIIAKTDNTFVEAVELFNASMLVKKVEGDSLAPVQNIPNELFLFDPNRISSDSLELLGLSKRTVSSIIKYREKGGRFKKAQDLAKIYNLPENDYNRLLAYIVIQEKQKADFNSDTVFRKEMYSTSNVSQKPNLHPLLVELNAADTTELDKIYGIGPYIARKIVERREALGGFINVSQLLEIYPINNEVLDRIEPHLTLDTLLIHKINLNTIDLSSLKKHPYFKYSIANSLVNIRKNHGNYYSKRDLYRSDLMTDSIYNLIQPYIKFND